MAKSRDATGGATDPVPGWLALAKASQPEKRLAKKGLYLSVEGAWKLATAALVEQLDQSVIVDALCRTELSGYKAYVARGKGSPWPEEEEAG
jgi:hypothetical protein